MSTKDVNTSKYFLRGPIPLDHLIVAAQGGRSVIIVFLLICFHYGLLRKDSFKIQKKFREYFNISRQSFSRALVYLENSNAISVERFPGATPLITLKWAGIGPNRGKARTRIKDSKQPQLASKVKLKTFGPGNRLTDFKIKEGTHGK